MCEWSLYYLAYFKILNIVMLMLKIELNSRPELLVFFH